ncbi:hypothetical protein BSL82_09590 [Tardibacter chloracetimidivorans]|uniref:Uncharacterized protein n=1 Tax=Tardibacter chloracetimidivorans TaxID=1921510 RepID=A0A1L3ZV80_9SPHN|nr:hypothetical protein [Tardibacter chloracetimidivorans]API59533.1 hypothetical protein BSL82_09590 [Tardibacter chloracetimidivorans]
MAKRVRAKRKVEENLGEVNEFARAHGMYEPSTVVDLTGELGGRRNSMVKVMLNRGGTAIERWMNESPNMLFAEPQKAAVRYCQTLWLRADGLVALQPGTDRIDAPLGWSQQEALSELSTFKRRIPAKYWDVFENVCRFDQEAGTAGSSLSTNKRSAVDAAKTCVAMVASLIAMWRGM